MKKIKRIAIVIGREIIRFDKELKIFKNGVETDTKITKITIVKNKISVFFSDKEIEEFNGVTQYVVTYTK